MDKMHMDRKIRIDEAGTALHHAQMDETTAEALFERATDLSSRAFGQDTSDDHIEWAYQRLVMNWRWGADERGVVTVH